jgi:hypothetical protein
MYAGWGEGVGARTAQAVSGFDFRSPRPPGYRRNVSVAGRWLVGGVLAIAVALAVWPTTFILVPAGVVLVATGATKWVRSIWATHSRSR